jgi:hypothetical protein
MTWTQQQRHHAGLIKQINNGSGTGISSLARHYSPQDLLNLRDEIGSSDLYNMRWVLAYYQSLAYWMLVNGRWYRK